MRAAELKNYESESLVQLVGKRRWAPLAVNVPPPPFTFSAKLLLIDLDLKVAKLACIRFHSDY